MKLNSNKKDNSAKALKKRAFWTKIIICTIMAMIMITVLVSMRLTVFSEPMNQVPVLAAMNSQLDSLLKADFPKGTRVVIKSSYELITRETESESDASITRLRIEMAEETGSDAADSLREAYVKERKVAEAGRYLQHDNYERNIRIKSEGRPYIYTQVTTKDLRHSSLEKVMCLDDESVASDDIIEYLSTN